MGELHLSPSAPPRRRSRLRWRTRCRHQPRPAASRSRSTAPGSAPPRVQGTSSSATMARAGAGRVRPRSRSTPGATQRSHSLCRRRSPRAHRRRLQLLGQRAGKRRLHPRRRRQSRWSDVHLDEREALLSRQHPRRWADDARQRDGRGQHARPARVLDRRRHAGDDHGQLHRRQLVDRDGHLERLGGGSGRDGTAAATLPYRNSTSGSSQQLTVYVYATTGPVDPSKTVKSITFPDVSNTTSGGATSMHIWAVSLGTK